MKSCHAKEEQKTEHSVWQTPLFWLLTNHRSPPPSIQLCIQELASGAFLPPRFRRFTLHIMCLWRGEETIQEVLHTSVAQNPAQKQVWFLGSFNSASQQLLG